MCIFHRSFKSIPSHILTTRKPFIFCFCESDVIFVKERVATYSPGGNEECFFQWMHSPVYVSEVVPSVNQTNTRMVIVLH